jgi:hypothetical protein
MEFEYPGKELLDLLSNPLKNKQVYVNYSRAKYYVSMIMLKLGIFGIYFNQKAIVNLILGSFRNVANAAELEAKEISEITSNSTQKTNLTNSEKYVRNLLHEIRNHISTYVALEYSDVSEASELINKRIDIYQLTSYEYNKSRVSDKLNLNLSDLELFPSSSNLWLAFYFSEILYLVLNGQLEVSLYRGEIYIYPHEKYKTAFKIDWLSVFFESSSENSDLLELRSISNFIYRHPITLENSEKIVTRCLDKIFSLNIEMLSENLQNSTDIITLKEIVLFSVCVECASYEGLPIPESFFYEKTNIRNKTINRLITVLSNDNKDKSITSIDSFIFYENRFFKRGCQNFKYGLKRLVGKVFEDGFIGSNDPKGDIGKSFESDYILNYLKDLNYLGYQAYEGFKPRTGSKYKYDIDLVLEDKDQNLFFFIQVKYWFSNLPIYLDEQIKFFNGEKLQHGVIKQLVTLKDNIDEKSIRDKLNACGLGGAKKGNSYFILLHNIPFLNFYQFSGVIFYEWNVLRNILQNGRVFVEEYKKGVNKSTNCIYTPSKPPFHKPHELVEGFFSRNDNFGESISLNWEIHKNTWNSLNLNGVKFKVRVL